MRSRILFLTLLVGLDGRRLRRREEAVGHDRRRRSQGGPPGRRPRKRRHRQARPPGRAGRHLRAVVRRAHRQGARRSSRPSTPTWRSGDAARRSSASQTGGPMAKFWDGSRPFAICVSPCPPRASRSRQMIMPITDVAKAKEVQGGPPRVFSGSYMSMVMGNAAPAEPSQPATHRLLKDAGHQRSHACASTSPVSWSSSATRSTAPWAR